MLGIRTRLMPQLDSAFLAVLRACSLQPGLKRLEQEPFHKIRVIEHVEAGATTKIHPPHFLPAVVVGLFRPKRNDGRVVHVRGAIRRFSGDGAYGSRGCAASHSRALERAIWLLDEPHPVQSRGDIVETGKV